MIKTSVAQNIQNFAAIAANKKAYHQEARQNANTAEPGGFFGVELLYTLILIGTPAQGIFG